MKDYLQYAGRTAVVTGAASGIGKAVTEILVNVGARVHTLDYAEVTTPGIASYHHIDLGVKDQIDAAFAELPDTIDAYFGIAGVSGQRNDWNTTVLINFGANKYITDTYLGDRMAAHGAIAYVSSTAGLNWEKHTDEVAGITTSQGWEETAAAIEALEMNDRPGPEAYPVSKRLVNQYATEQAAFFASRGIRVNAIMPASTKSGLTEDFALSVGGMDNLVKYTGFAERLAEAREMAEPLVFLNSPMASYISGVVLPVDFGSRTVQTLGLIPDPLDVPMIRAGAAA